MCHWGRAGVDTTYDVLSVSLNLLICQIETLIIDEELPLVVVLRYQADIMSRLSSLAIVVYPQDLQLICRIHTVHTQGQNFGTLDLERVVEPSNIVGRM